MNIPHLIDMSVLKPYLILIVNKSALNFVDLQLSRAQFHPLTIYPSYQYHTDKIGPVTSDTRPSHLCLKCPEGLGMS